MENLKVHKFLLRRTSEQTNHPKVGLEFIELILSALKRNNQKFYLNIPETIVYLFGCSEPHMIYTKDNGQLSWHEEITSSSVRQFFKRCYYFKREQFPVNIIKSDRGNFFDSCKCLMSTKECYGIWKQHIKSGNPILVQRFIICPKKEIFKIRITYIPPKGIFYCKLIKNRIDVLGEPANPIEGKSGWKKFRKFYSHEPKKVFTAEDKFLVRKTRDSSYTESEFSINDSLRSQMETLKRIIEKGNFINGKTNCLELQADFAQDADEKWYFLNLVHYKTEFSIQKKLNPASFGLIMDRISRRTAKSSYGKHKISLADKTVICSSPNNKQEPAISVTNARPLSADKKRNSNFLSPNTSAAKLLTMSSMKLDNSQSSILLEIPHLDESRNSSTDSLTKEVLKDLQSFSRREFEIRKKPRSKTMNVIRSKIR
ncbi:unnamed protein product [Blepharisma stoltei]|uniref:Ycf1 n=1 Tax=Blepharisma stoltei TaxID=1481888 RepID=A0AAU9IDF3_9CILI|nr:unnamed protein product [Blepharisma stoltei]